MSKIRLDNGAAENYRPVLGGRRLSIPISVLNIDV